MPNTSAATDDTEMAAMTPSDNLEVSLVLFLGILNVVGTVAVAGMGLLLVACAVVASSGAALVPSSVFGDVVAMDVDMCLECVQ